MANFAKNIKAARLGAKLTQDELAEKISVTRQAVSNWENGKTEPYIDTLTKLAEVTNGGTYLRNKSEGRRAGRQNI